MEEVRSSKSFVISKGMQVYLLTFNHELPNIQAISQPGDPMVTHALLRAIRSVVKGRLSITKPQDSYEFLKYYFQDNGWLVVEG